MHWLRIRQSFTARIRWPSLFGLGIVLIFAGGLFQHVDAPARSRTMPLENITIVIDPGHGGIDPGCHREDLFEKDIVLAVGQLLSEELATKGAHVILTRSADVELSHLTNAERTRHRRDLRARVEMANDGHADLFVSLHVNTAASGQLGGAMVFYHPSSSRGKALAEQLVPELAKVVPGNQNVSLPANFYILRHSSMPSVLVEIGFLSNPADRVLLVDSLGQQRIVKAITAGIESFFGAPTGEDEATPSLTVAGLVQLFPLVDDHPCLEQ